MFIKINIYTWKCMIYAQNNILFYSKKFQVFVQLLFNVMEFCFSEENFYY